MKRVPIDKKVLNNLNKAATRLMTTELFQNMPGFTVPLQHRTRIKTSAVIATAAYLLRMSSFSSITMSEIANIANCTVPSIYARFNNKEALLPAMHLLLIEETREILDNEIYLDRFLNKGLHYFCETFVAIIVEYFITNHHFVQAAILSEATAVHAQLSALLPVLTERLNKIVPLLLQRTPDSTRPSVLFGIGLIISLLRDAAVVRPLERTRDREMLARLLSHVIANGIAP